jgi:hypothetical protein
MSYQRTAYLQALRARLQREGGQFRGSALATKGELRLLSLDTELFNEPEDLTDTEDIQGPGGGFAFQLDVSVLDGDDPLA